MTQPKYCNCEFGCDCETEILLLNRVIEIAAEDRGKISGAAELFVKAWRAQAESELAQGKLKT